MSAGRTKVSAVLLDTIDSIVYVPLVLKEIGHEAAKSLVVVHVKLNIYSDSGPWRLSVAVPAGSEPTEKVI